MRIAVLGAGAMGSTAAVLLARHADVDLLVLDVDLTRAEKVVAHIGRGEAHEIDITGGRLADDLRNSGAQTVAACIPYRLNVPVMEACPRGRVPLRGPRRPVPHDPAAARPGRRGSREAGLSAVLGIGSAPGHDERARASAAPTSSTQDVTASTCFERRRRTGSASFARSLLRRDRSSTSSRCRPWSSRTAS